MYLLQRKIYFCLSETQSFYDKFYFQKKSYGDKRLSIVWLGGWGPSRQTNFRSHRSNSPALPILLCLSTAIEPQKEEADENYNSVNTRMRKTQVGSLFPELENFS